MTFDRTVFVTTVTWQRTLLFRNPQKAELMMDVLAHHGEQKKYVMHEFVIMPDHLHLLLTPAADISLERAMQLIKGGGVSTRQDWAREREDWSGRKASPTIGFATSGTTLNMETTFA